MGRIQSFSACIWISKISYLRFIGADSFCYESCIDVSFLFVDVDSISENVIFAHTGFDGNATSR